MCIYDIESMLHMYVVHLFRYTVRILNVFKTELMPPDVLDVIFTNTIYWQHTCFQAHICMPENEKNGCQRHILKRIF